MTYSNSITFLPKPTGPLFQDLTDKVYGRLTVLGFAGQKSPTYNSPMWHCLCSCGSIVQIHGGCLRRGETISCGCFRREEAARKFTTHRESLSKKQSPEMRAYYQAKFRCEDTSGNPRYSRWAGRGIQFRFSSLEHFLSVVGRRPSAKHSLDRIDNEGHYEPGNVRWATISEQNRNTRANRILTVNGKSQCVAAWAENLGVNPSSLYSRVSKGWCDDCIINADSCSHRFK